MADEQTGAMVALVPTDADAARLAVDDGEPADELHLTLFYLGDAADYDDAARAAILDGLRGFVDDTLRPYYDLPLTADGFAIDVFNPGDVGCCVVLGVSGGDLEAVWDAAADTLDDLEADDAGFMLPEQHSPWIPHITIAYTDDPAALVPEVLDSAGPVTFDRLRVAFAGQYTDIPLTGPGLKRYDPAQFRANDGRWSVEGLPGGLSPKVFDSFTELTGGRVTSAPAKDAFDALVAVAHVHGADVPGGLSVGQVAQAVDREFASKHGLGDAHLVEDQLTDWLGTRVGSKYAERNLDPKSELLSRISGGPASPPPKVRPLAGPGGYRQTDGPFAVVSPNDMQHLQDKTKAELGVGWTPRQEDAVSRYTGGSYASMNDFLRNKTDFASPLTRQYIDDVQSAMVPLPRGVALVRGAGWDQLPKGFRDEASAPQLVGKTINDAGFLSTSLSGATSNFDRKPVQLQIEAPAGTPGIFVGELSRLPHEAEVLLAAGTQMKVLDVVPGAAGVVLRVRVVTPQ